MTSFLLGNFSIPLSIPVLNNISETLTRISTMNPRVMILTIYFSLEFLFVGELVILGKCDEFLLHKETQFLPHQMYIVLVHWRSVTSSISLTLSSLVKDK